MKAQIKSREDSINYLTSISLEYMNQMYNEHNVESAASLWGDDAFRVLVGSYMECNPSNQKRTNAETLQAFKKDLLDYKEFKNKKTFKEVFNTIFLSVNDTQKMFTINIYIENFNPSDTVLKYQALDFYSMNNGKTWLIQKDVWAEQFVYSLCRRNKNYR
ncbi:MAG: hypothetical protein QM737_18850 [Ferruginibacter sp.]